jgi:hypothetical protein
MTHEQALELAKSVRDGKPTDRCPILFSYVSAAVALADYVLELQGAIILDGWKCEKCQGFSGDLKKRLTHCCWCGAPRQ